MNNDSYKIVISLSHRRISFEYWLRDGENKLLPMPGGDWPSPLAFYCSQTGIIIGEDAARAAKSGTANAFDNYFERLSDGEAYQYGGQSKQIGNLLLDAAESVFRSFYRDILFNRYGSITENRANMPLMIVCENDIESNEKAYLTNLFKDSGYGRIRVVDYDKYIEQYIDDTLSKEYTCDNVLVAWSEGIDLRLTLFDVRSQRQKQSLLLKGLGVDPRMKYVKDLIWNDFKGQNPWLIKDREIMTIEKAASDFLNSTSPMVSELIPLSDGQSYRYSLIRTKVDFIQSDESQAIKLGLDQFLRISEIVNRNRTILLLRGTAAGNSYFEQNLSHGFLKVIRSDDKLRRGAMNLLLKEQIPVSEQKIETTQAPSNGGKNEPTSAQQHIVQLNSLNKEWRILRASLVGKEVDVVKSAIEVFLSKCDLVSGAEDLVADIKSYFAERTPKVDTEQIKAMGRKWREIKASAKGKVRMEDYSSARTILNEFIQECCAINGAEELVGSAKAELNQIPTIDEKKAPAKSLKEKKTDTSAHRVDNRHSVEAVINVRHASDKPKIEKEGGDLRDKGLELLSQNKVKEAREWYRKEGNTVKSGILNDIIRQQKGIELRVRTIDEYRKNKNIDQIGRIIKELETFVDLCDKVGLPASPYKKALIEYRKIK